MISVRSRQAADLPALVTMLERTHHEVGYPVRLSNVRAGWIAEDDELGGWVALVGDEVLGHVALHPAHGPCVPLWCEATGRDESGLAVLSRLFTSGTRRGAGVALLDAAVEAAGERAPVLEVDLRSSAHGLYLRHGWRQVGEVDQLWGSTSVRVAAMALPRQRVLVDPAQSGPR